MKISVAVPSLGYARFLGATLESIRMQTHADFEVLIADGGSTDGSREIIDDYVARDARFRLVSTSDTGQADALNKAMREASGEVHCFLDADDVYLCTDAFAAAIDAFAHYPDADLVSFTGWYIDVDGRPMREIRLRYHPRDNFDWIRRRSSVLQPATFWRRAVTERFSFRTEYAYVFDAMFFYECFLAFRWMELTKPIAGARVHAGSKSGMIIPARIREIAELEKMRSGPATWRAVYVKCIAAIVGLALLVPGMGKRLSVAVYRIVNSLAYLSFYRLPGI